VLEVHWPELFWETAEVSDTTAVPIPPDVESADPSESEPNNPRLDRWINKTTLPLDLLALCTIWLTVVPLGTIHQVADQPMLWYVGRLALSVIYGTDMAVRTYLSRHRLRYFTHHPVGVLAVILPVIRLLFSLRLLRAMFKKGNTGHFVFVSIVLLFNLVVIVWGFERTASGANITSLGIAVWWGCVTVFTVGYGDYYPITTPGRIAAVGIMVLGLTTAAVITAQIASGFMDQAQSRRNAASGPDDDSTDGRIRRIEEMLNTHFEQTDATKDQT
jgi:voltage-gated potassium channel